MRRKFQSKSRIFNLVHIPDRLDQAEKEALQWFGSLECSQTPIPIEVVENELILARYCEKAGGQIDPEDAFLQAKARLLHALKNKGRTTEPLSALFLQASRFYSQWSSKILENEECGGIEGTILPEWQRQEQILFAQILDVCREDREKSKALQVVFNLAACSKIPANFFWVLDEWGVYLSELEQYLVLSRLKYYHPSSE